MPRRAARLSVLAAMMLAMCACLGDMAHRRELDALVREGASDTTVIEKLGAGETVHERGMPSWTSLQQFLDREPPTSFMPLRRAVEKYPRIVYYTTAFQMTWLFFDEHRKLREYYLCAQ